MDDTSRFTESDPFSPIVYSYEGVRVLHREKSPYQKIEVLDHPFFGRVLVLDGVVQLTQRDEFLYHEMLVHPLMHAHPKPETVLIIGGGDGGSLREVLKHRSVTQAVLIDIDDRVTVVASQHFPGIAATFEDARVERRAEGGYEFLLRDDRKFDVVIVDSTDPVGAARELFEDTFYEAAAARMGDEGMLVTQSESLLFHAEFVRQVQERLSAHFGIVDCYTQPLATYAGNWWTFSVGSKSRDVRKPGRRRVVEAKYYDRDVHRSAFLSQRLLTQLCDGSLPW
jgi:spermidine synthase